MKSADQIPYRSSRCLAHQTTDRVVPIPVLDRLPSHPQHPANSVDLSTVVTERGYAALPRKTSLRASSAQLILAILFANATATTLCGFLVKRFLAHMVELALPFRAKRSTALTPMTRSFRM